MGYIYKAKKTANLFMIKVYAENGGQIPGYRDVHFSIFHDYDPAKNLKVKPNGDNAAGIIHFTFIDTNYVSTHIYISGQNIDALKMTDKYGFTFSSATGATKAAVDIASELLKEMKFIISSLPEFRNDFAGLSGGTERSIAMAKYDW
jgi:hypothetical protein